MKRTLVQLDEPTYRLLRRRAFEQGMSLAALVREAVRAYLAPASDRPARASEFTFVAAGRSEQPAGRPVSVYHDEELEKAFGG